MYAATDIRGPAFQYQKVVGARVPVLNSSQSPSPLYFCRAMPFNVAIPIIQKLGPGCDGKNLCWAAGQQTDQTLPEGPYLTEWTVGGDSSQYPTHIVGIESLNKAVYTFQEYFPSAEEGYTWIPQGQSIILIFVVQPNGATGYLVLDPTLTGDEETPLFPTTIVSLDAAIASKTMWGVVGATVSDTGSSNTALLMYYDSVVCGAKNEALPLMQAFSWQNSLYFSRGVQTKGSTGTYGAFHGATPASYTAFSPTTTLTNGALQYDSSTMTLTPQSLPAFNPDDVDNGALNLTWSLILLPLSSLSANVYSETYCVDISTGADCLDGKVCTQWAANTPNGVRCRAVRAASPIKAFKAVSQACAANSSQPLPECACVNATASGIPEKSLFNLTYGDFLKFLQSNGLSNLNILQTTPAECWWPACNDPAVIGPTVRPNGCVDAITGPCLEALTKLSSNGATKLDDNAKTLCEYRNPSLNNGGMIAMWVVVALGGAAIIAVAIYFIVKAAKKKKVKAVKP